MPSPKEYQNAFVNLVAEIMIEDVTGADFIKYQSVMGMINTLYADRREDELNMILRLHFPDYYTDYKPFKVK